MAEVDNELLKEAIKVVIEHKAANSSTLQRYLGIGYGQAHQLLQKMEDIGVITDERNVRMRIVIPNTVENGLWHIDHPVPNNEPPIDY